MSNFYNTTGIEMISMVQEEQTEFNVLTEGFFGTIGDFIKRLWNGVISFIKTCYNKINVNIKIFSFL